MCLLTNLGSKNCLITDIIINKITIAIPNFKSPFRAEIIAQGIITVPEPSIGSASINEVIKAIIMLGYLADRELLFLKELYMLIIEDKI